VPPEASADEDTRIWIGQVGSGHEAEHLQFVDWLNGAEAQEIFRRRRLTEYELWEQDGQVVVRFKAPHTGDPRLLIDFLRYPGVWPPFWEFVRGGRAEDEPVAEPPASAVKVHWRHPAASGAGGG
jgi:hypothetical protein